MKWTRELVNGDSLVTFPIVRISCELVNGSSLVTFPVVLIRYPSQSRLRKEGVLLAQNSQELHHDRAGQA